MSKSPKWKGKIKKESKKMKFELQKITLKKKPIKIEQILNKNIGKKI